MLTPRVVAVQLKRLVTLLDCALVLAPLPDETYFPVADATHTYNLARFGKYVRSFSDVPQLPDLW